MEPAYRLLVQTLLAGPFSLTDVDALDAWCETMSVSEEQQKRVLGALGIHSANQLRESADNACAVCLDAIVANLALVPCGETSARRVLAPAMLCALSLAVRVSVRAAGHACFCEPCARKLRDCAVCRAPVRQLLPTFRR